MWLCGCMWGIKTSLFCSSAFGPSAHCMHSQFWRVACRERGLPSSLSSSLHLSFVHSMRRGIVCRSHVFLSSGVFESSSHCVSRTTNIQVSRVLSQTAACPLTTPFPPSRFSANHLPYFPFPSINFIILSQLSSASFYSPSHFFMYRFHSNISSLFPFLLSASLPLPQSLSLSPSPRSIDSLPSLCLFLSFSILLQFLVWFSFLPSSPCLPSVSSLP